MSVIVKEFFYCSLGVGLAWGIFGIWSIWGTMDWSICSCMINSGSSVFSLGIAKLENKLSEISAIAKVQVAFSMDYEKKI